jgi:hypothetical protein
MASTRFKILARQALQATLPIPHLLSQSLTDPWQGKKNDLSQLMGDWVYPFILSFQICLLRRKQYSAPMQETCGGYSYLEMDR